MQWLATLISQIWTKLFAAIETMWTAAWRWMTNIWFVVGLVFTGIATVLLNAGTVLAQIVNATIAGSFSGDVATGVSASVAFVNSFVPLYEGMGLVTLLFTQRLVLAAYRLAKSWLPTLSGA